MVEDNKGMATSKFAFCVQNINFMVKIFTQIHELEKTQPFSSDTRLLYLIRSCLRVNYSKRLSATEAQTFL